MSLLPARFFTVAPITGRSAVLSEDVHSAVDTFNGVLQPRKPGLQAHPLRGR
jgi:hypothetical protein